MHVKLFALLLVLGVALSAPVEAAASGTTFTQAWSSPVAPGVTHANGTVATDSSSSVHVLDVDVGDPAIHVRTALPMDRVNAVEPVSQQALRNSREGHRVVGAINGSFFNAWGGGLFSARGLNVRAGELVTAGPPTSNGRFAVFAIDEDGDPIIGAPAIEMSATLPDGTVVPLVRLNQTRLENEAVLYTERYDTRTWTATEGVEVVLEGMNLPLAPGGPYTGTVGAIQHGSTDTEIAPGTVVLSASGTRAEPFADVDVGDQVTLELDIDSGWEDVSEAVGGRETLVRDGQVDIQPSGLKKSLTSEPRSAVGITAAGRVLMVTVDGRRSDSPGVTIPQLASLMLELGAVDAINLDGGGSTTLAVRALGTPEVTVANQPSGSSERAVANSLLVVSNAPTGPLAGVAVVPAIVDLPIGSTQQFELGGYDAAYNGVAPPAVPVSWSVDTSAASITAGGLLTAEAAGTTTVTASAGEWTANALVTTPPDPGTLTVSPPSVSFVPNAKTRLGSIPMLISWSAANPQGSITSVQLQRRADGGSWRSISLSGTPTSVKRRFAYGRRFELRIRATDSFGSRSAWVYGAPFTLDVRNANGPSVVRTDGWSAITSVKVSDGEFLRSQLSGAALQVSPDATQVAIIGQRGPGYGSLAVAVDGQQVANVALVKSRTQWRRVLFVAEPQVPLSAAGTAPMVLDIRNTSAGTLKVDVNAFVYLVPSG